MLSRGINGRRYFIGKNKGHRIFGFHFKLDQLLIFFGFAQENFQFLDSSQTSSVQPKFWKKYFAALQIAKSELR